MPVKNISLAYPDRTRNYPVKRTSGVPVNCLELFCAFHSLNISTRIIYMYIASHFVSEDIISFMFPVRNLAAIVLSSSSLGSFHRGQLNSVMFWRVFSPAVDALLSIFPNFCRYWMKDPWPDRNGRKSCPLSYNNAGFYVWDQLHCPGCPTFIILPSFLSYFYYCLS